MGDADRDEARNLARFLRLARLAREVDEAQRVVEARRRLDLQLRIDSVRCGQSVDKGTFEAAVATYDEMPVIQD